MIDIINTSRILDLLVLLGCSIYIRIVLALLSQTWVKTIAHTATITVLPLITYTITNVISGNIALSLGMVGALSIVRFRNPVRSPLELSVYFTAITMGIAASVTLKWLLFLMAALTLACGTLMLITVFSKNVLKREFFISSFSEGNALSTLLIHASDNITDLQYNKYLTSKTVENSDITYLLAAADFDELRRLELEFSQNSHVKRTELRKS